MHNIHFQNQFLLLTLLPHRPIVLMVTLLCAIGVPMYYFVIKRRAAASLAELLAERFSMRVCPVSVIAVPSGGRIRFHSAYDDASGSGLVLVLGNWVWRFAKGGAYKRVAGLFKPGGDAAWLERVRSRPDAIVAATVEGGALVVWKGLPSRKSVLAHFEAVSASSAKG